MLSKKRMTEYTAERFEKIRQYHSDFSFFCRQDDLHQFRVEIKKVRMVTRIVDHCLGEKKASEAFLPLKALFKQAGEIRSIHIEIGILEKYALKGSHLLKAKEKDLQRKSEIFIRKQDEYTQVIQETEAGIISILQDFDDKDVVEYIEELIDKTSRNLSRNENKENIHKARSLMKVALYTTSLINRQIREMIPLDIEYMTDLQELIGHWHDADIALDKLRPNKAIPSKIIKSMEDEANDLSRQVFLASRDFSDRIYAMA